MGGDRIERVELRRLRMPLVRPFRTALGVTAERDVLLVRVVDGDGAEGWGECAAESTPRYWYETADSAHEVLRRWLVPALVARPALASGLLLGTGELRAAAGVTGHPMAAAALEMAVLDLHLRRAGDSLVTWLGRGGPAGVTPARSVIATFTAGTEDDPVAAVAAGYRSVKLKLAGPGGLDDLERAVGTLRAAPEGQSLPVSADANGSLGYHELEQGLLDRLDALGLTHLEQPLAADDLAGHRELALRLATPICLDESATSPGVVAAALELGGARAVCVKPSRLGGLAAAVATARVCARDGVPAKVGGMLETGLGRAAALALAALPGFSLPPDLSASDRYWPDGVDIAEPLTLDGEGRLPVPTAPGLGIQLRGEVVEALTVSLTSMDRDG